MTQPGSRCAACNRSDYERDGETHPLEVCWSSRHEEYRCMGCHFIPTDEELKRSEDRHD